MTQQKNKSNPNSYYYPQNNNNYFSIPFSLLINRKRELLKDKLSWNLLIYFYFYKRLIKKINLVRF